MLVLILALILILILILLLKQIILIRILGLEDQCVSRCAKPSKGFGSYSYNS